MKTQRRDTEKNYLIEEGKKINIAKIIRQNALYKTVLTYFLKCIKNIKSINPKISAINDGKAMILSNCNICGSKKSKFIKKQEANGQLSSLGIKTPLIKIPLVVPILF